MSTLSLSCRFALLLAALLGLAPGPARATLEDPLDAIGEDDREALEAFALYPGDVRVRALEVAAEPGTLVEVLELQSASQETFRKLLAPYDQSDQEELYELSRYPDLIGEISRGGEKTRGELQRIASRYPEEVREAAVRQGIERPRLVSRMYALLEDFGGRFEELIEDLPPPRPEAFRAMLRSPELLSLIAEHTDMTVLLGDAYDRDPDGLLGALEQLNLDLAQRNAEDVVDWQEAVDSDPDLRRDYDAAARDYERDTGYSAYGPRTILNVHVHSYPYWFGYPWWYPVSYVYYDPWYWWYPRRSWGHCGYAYGPRVVIWHAPRGRPWYPSFHFTSWYFSSGHHHSHYPHLSERFVSFYGRPVAAQRHFRHHGVHERVIRKFVHETDRVMPAELLAEKDRRPRIERFRELGKLAPDIEKAQSETRRKDFVRRGGRPGRDFDLRPNSRGDERAQPVPGPRGGEHGKARDRARPSFERSAREGDRARERSEDDDHRILRSHGGYGGRAVGKGERAGRSKEGRDAGTPAAPNERGRERSVEPSDRWRKSDPRREQPSYQHSSPHVERSDGGGRGRGVRFERQDAPRAERAHGRRDDGKRHRRDGGESGKVRNDKDRGRGNKRG